MSNSVRPHRRQPTRLPRPWDSPGENTGVGCHFLFQCMKVKSESEVAQSRPTLSDPMDCSLPGSSVHGILQARVQSQKHCDFPLKHCFCSSYLIRGVSDVLRTCYKLNPKAALRSEVRRQHQLLGSRLPNFFHHPPHSQHSQLHSQSG